MRAFIINVLLPEDLLRMKVIAVDTSLMGSDLGGEFTRTKDFNDIKSFMGVLGYDMIMLIKETSDYMLENETFKLINQHIKTGKNRFIV